MVKGFIDSTLYFHLAFQQVVYQVGSNAAWQLMIDMVGSFVEYVAEDAVVEFQFVVGLFGFLDSSHIAIIEAQGTPQIVVDGRGRDHLEIQDLQDGFGLGDSYRLPTVYGLSGCQRMLGDSMAAFYQHLQHEAAHLATVAVLGGVVPEQGDVLCTL